MRIVDARVRLPQHLRPQQSYDSPALQTEQYDRVLQLSDKVNAGTLSSLLDVMREENVDHAVMHAETETSEPAERLNESLVKVIAEHPAKFTGMGTVDTNPLRPSRMARQVAEIASLGLRGVSLQPAFIGLDIDDRLLYPTYARAEELGLIVALHTGVTYSRMHPIRHERPELLDQVACDFPDLKLIACHAGWPWVTEFCAVARRHPTVYLEFGGLAPKYVAKPGTGWDTLFTMMPNVLKDQVLYGTDWPVMAPERALAEWRASGLPQDALAALFGGNAIRLFGLTP
jgi:uncharacterized protein